jgi:hypothetical protein
VTFELLSKITPEIIINFFTHVYLIFLKVLTLPKVQTLPKALTLP